MDVTALVATPAVLGLVPRRPSHVPAILGPRDDLFHANDRTFRTALDLGRLEWETFNPRERPMPDSVTTTHAERRNLVRRADWVGYARRVASRDYSSRSDSHRFIDDITVDGHVFAYIANNHPYADAPHLRKAEHALFREWAAAEGVRVLAEQTYPRSGDEAGFTSILVLDLDPLEPADKVLLSLTFERYRELAGSEAAKRRAARGAAGMPPVEPPPE